MQNVISGSVNDGLNLIIGERRWDLLYFEDYMIEKRVYDIYSFTCGEAYTGFQKCKKLVSWKYSNASDISSVYGGSIRGLVLCTEE